MYIQGLTTPQYHNELLLTHIHTYTHTYIHVYMQGLSTPQYHNELVLLYLDSVQRLKQLLAAKQAGQMVVPTRYAGMYVCMYVFMYVCGHVYM
jgi:hypothetical protein